ncbi:hypothetical protein RND81_03G208500 [Saponaria officinalis]|uniref:Uncharacterized protein n=1 Tax=Saponaria officinalis TaxID=3572 RepID=A0AAW1M9R9_SAPOF
MATQLRLSESTRSTTMSEEEEDEEEKLVVEEVTKMADIVMEYRSTLPHHLNSTLSSLFVSLRSSLSLSSDLDFFLGEESCSGNSNRESAAANGETTTADVKLINEKICCNISALPKVLKRMNECISRIDRFVSPDEIVHPTFKRKTS